MFYCEPCRKTRAWPGLFFVSVGPCEVCGKTASCYDVPSKYLPLAVRREGELRDEPYAH